MAAGYLLGELEAMGYRAELQTFTLELLSRDMPLLSVTAPEGLDIDAIPMALSGEGHVSGALVHAGKALDGDVLNIELGGRIALIERGDITFDEKVTRVAAAGALAAVVYNNEPGLFGGRLARQAAIPAVSISMETGVALRALIAGGETTATVFLVRETRESRNVIAEKPGTGGDGRVVVLGGHFDTVPDTPGANDNGSGIATLLTVAREARDRSYPFTVRFVAFGAEEVGLYGSRSYVDSLSERELESVVAMLNFDVPGSGSVNEVLGSFELLREVLDYGRESGMAVRLGTPLEGATSDHASFSDAGVPVVFFLADDLSRIHKPDDGLEFVRPELMGTAAALGLALLDILGEP